MDKIKNLSDAMELGATIKRQCYGAISDVIENKTCAIGAAMDGLGILDAGDTERHEILAKRFPILQTTVSCPHRGCHCDGVFFTVITHLNDHHKWTREKIAKWVREVEKTL